MGDPFAGVFTTRNLEGAVFVNEVVRSIMQPDAQVRLRRVTLGLG